MFLEKKVEFNEKISEQINESRKSIKKSKDGSLKWKIIGLVMFLITTGGTYYFHIHDSKNEEKIAIQSILNQQEIFQKQIENQNRNLLLQNKIQELNKIFDKKIETSNKIVNALYRLSVYLCRHENNCQIKNKNEYERPYDKFDIMESIHDTDGILGEEVANKLKAFRKKFEETYSPSVQKKNGKRYRLSSGEVRIIKNKILTLSNKNIQKTKYEIDRLNDILNPNDSPLIINEVNNSKNPNEKLISILE